MSDATSATPLVVCGPTCGCSHMYPANLPKCPKCGKENYVRLQATSIVATTPLPTPTASAPKAEAATGEDLAVYQSIADNYEHATKPAPAVAENVPLTPEQANNVWRRWVAAGHVQCDWLSLLRLTEAAHGIGSGSAQEGQAK